MEPRKNPIKNRNDVDLFLIPFAKIFDMHEPSKYGTRRVSTETKIAENNDWLNNEAAKQLASMYKPAK